MQHKIQSVRTLRRNENSRIKKKSCFQWCAMYFYWFFPNLVIHQYPFYWYFMFICIHFTDIWEQSVSILPMDEIHLYPFYQHLWFIHIHFTIRHLFISIVPMSDIHPHSFYRHLKLLISTLQISGIHHIQFTNIRESSIPNLLMSENQLYPFLLMWESSVFSLLSFEIHFTDIISYITPRKVPAYILLIRKYFSWDWNYFYSTEQLILYNTTL